MSDCEWMGPAQDCLKDRGLDEAADALARLPGVEDRLERTICLLESAYAYPLVGVTGVRPRAIIRAIAEHRGETPKATRVRLRPPLPDALSRQPADRDTLLGVRLNDLEWGDHR